MLRASMTSENLAVIFLVCLAFAVTANAQIAESDSEREHDSRAAAPTPQTPGIGDEASPADNNSTAATGNSLSICQIVEFAAAANGLPVEFFARVIWQESRFRPDTVGPITRTGQRAQRYCSVHADDGCRAPSAQSFRSAPGATEIGRVPARAASPIWQSWLGGRRL
jgi:hypothetical protein